MTCRVARQTHYGDEHSGTTVKPEPQFSGYQLIGDSQFLRFSEHVLNRTRYRKNGLAYLGLCVSGQKTNDLFARIKNNFHPISSRVILMIGTNDLLKNTCSDTLRSDFQDMISYLLLQKNVQKLILLTVPPVPRMVKSYDHWKTLKELNKHILENYKGIREIKVIDAYSRFIKKGDLSRSSLSLSRNSQSPSQNSLSSSRSSTNLRIQVEDVKNRTIFITGPDSEDEAKEESDQDFGEISITTTPSGKRSSSTFSTPNPKRQSLGSGSYSIAQDDHNDDMCYDDDRDQVDLSEEINYKYFEEFFDSDRTRPDLIHLNVKGLRLIRELISNAIDG